jgi:uncharacterized protein
VTATTPGMQTDSGAIAELVDALARFLASPQAGSLSLPALDGYLTAVAIGPELVMPSEWMSGLWRGDAPAFADGAEAQTILSAIMARYNQILSQLGRSPPDFRPLYAPRAPSERPPMALVAQWANGFWRGMMLRRGDWRPLVLDRGARNLLAPIVCFAEDDTGRRVLKDTRGADDDLLKKACDLIPTVVPAIRDYWQQRAGHSMTPRPARRPGRNEPCPCGSGRKYKRCCGAGGSRR